ncbi:hypothetical protein ACP4OV_009715 [Aristida adscensionis]
MMHTSSSMVRDILAKVDYFCEKIGDLIDQVNDNRDKLIKLRKQMKKSNSCVWNARH